MAIMSKNSEKSKLSKNVLFSANKHVFYCENSLRTLFCGQPSYMYIFFLWFGKYEEPNQKAGKTYVYNNTQTITYSSYRIVPPQSLDLL
jgi:hypothetical protein